MKTVRHGVFETNSSSTHSISIGPVRTLNQREGLPLTEITDEGIFFYPMRLSSYMTETSRSSETRCNTLEKKLAIVCQWILSCEEDFLEETIVDNAFERLKQEFNISEIVGRNEPYEYYYSSEYGDEPFSGDEDKFDNELTQLIEVIKDDNQLIIDSDVDN